MLIKRNIIFTLEKRKKSGEVVAENVPIRMRVLYKGNRIEFTTGYRIDSTKWEHAKQRVKNGTTNALKQSAADINADLNKYESEIQHIFKTYELSETIPTPQELKEAFNLALKKNETENTHTESDGLKSMFEVYDLFTGDEGRKNNWTDNTIEKMANVKKHLTGYNPNMTFEDWNEEGLIGYIDYLQNEGLRNSTIDKQFNFLKWFLKWALNKGYHNNITFRSFKPKLKKVAKTVVFLNWPELEQLKNYEIPKAKEYLERVRDVFLFCCYSSLRYSDVFQLKKSDVKGNMIDLISIKTGEKLMIDLNKYTKAILEKYGDVHFKNDKALPVISNQRMNEFLRELGRMAELNAPVRETYFKGNERFDEVHPKWEVLSTHAGRRTFICNALSLGIPPQVVMKWTGHSDYKSMKPYIDIADDIKANAMEKFNEL